MEICCPAFISDGLHGEVFRKFDPSNETDKAELFRQCAEEIKECVEGRYNFLMHIRPDIKRDFDRIFRKLDQAASGHDHAAKDQA